MGGHAHLLPLGSFQLFLHCCIVLGYRRQFSDVDPILYNKLLVGGVVVIGGEAVQVVLVAHFGSGLGSVIGKRSTPWITNKSQQLILLVVLRLGCNSGWCPNSPIHIR